MRQRLLARLQRRTNRSNAKPGQAMIEMALVMMILLILTFGIADVGLYMFRFVQGTNCTREVARRAAVRETDPGAAPFCSSADLRNSVSVTYAAGGDPGTDVTASLNVTHNWIAIGYLIPGMPDTIPIRSATTMRMEGEFET